MSRALVGKVRAKTQAGQVKDSGDISRSLDELAALLALSGESRFKVQAYERGARIVESLGDSLGSLLAEGRLTEVEGIGKTLSAQIEELWNTGHSKLLERARAEHPPGAAELSKLPGLTAKRIRALYEQLGIASLDALRAACDEQRVRTLKGFGEKTEQRLRDALAQGTEPSEPKELILADALMLASRIERPLRESGVAHEVVVAGAARRFEDTVRELELVAIAEDAGAVWTTLPRLPPVLRVDRASQTAKLSEGIALRLHVARPEQAGASLVYATGPRAHVHALEARASERGLCLSAEALCTAQGTPHAAGRDEVELYRALGLPYVPPELRNGGELAADASYEDLLSYGDVQGFVHCHTTYSDGRNSIEDMARAAEELGMTYITITDHSPSAHYAGGVEIDRLKRQWDEIAEVQERVKVRILRGAESDILADGSLDYPDDILEQLDVVIASIHGRFKMNRDEMTARLVRAMELPLFKIWGHALGRLLLSRAPIDCDVPKVLDALARSQGAIELNGDPYRMDLPSEWIPLAKERGIPFVVSVDAHSTGGLGALSYGVGMARRGGLRRHQVLNTLSAAEFSARVRPIARRGTA